MKKIKLCVMIFAAIAAFSMTGFADELVYPTGINFYGEEIGYEIPNDDVSLFSIDTASVSISFEEYLEEQCLKHSEKIDISKYSIPSSEIFEKYCNFAQHHPELLLRTKLSWTTTFFKKTVVNIIPEYIKESVADDEVARAFMDEKIDEYISYTDGFSDPLEKILVIHDKVIQQCKYDSDYADDSYHAYGIFANDTGVCQGYSQAFYMIMKKMGITTDFCYSDDINHMWNYILINGEWYHIDLTWDDPIVKNSNGDVVETTTAYHDNFLVSDDVMQNSHVEKTAWETYLSELPECNDTRYEMDCLFNIEKPFTIEFDGERFFVPYTLTDKSTIYLNSKSLETGPIVTAKPIVGKKSDTLYYYCVGDIKDGTDIVSVLYDCDNKMKSLETVKKPSLKSGNLYKQVYTFPSNKKATDNIVFFVTNLKNLKPFTEKITVK